MEEDPAYVEEVLAARRKRPVPSEPQKYWVEEAAFWEHRYLPVGSILAFESTLEEGDPDGEVAVLVRKTEHGAHGVTAWVSLVSVELLTSKVRVQKFFKKGEKRVHICYLTANICTAESQGDIHLREFWWFPPGEYKRPWVTAHGKRLVKEGLALSAQGTEVKDAGGDKAKGKSRVEERLSALRKKSPGRVSFAPGDHPARGDGDVGFPQDTAGGGILVLGGSPRSAAAPKRKVKEEPIAIPSDDDDPPSRRKDLGGGAMVTKRRGASVAVALAKAADAQQRRSIREKRRSRSRSRRRRKRRSRGRRDSRSRSQDQEEDSSSSSDSLIPPLRKKSRKDPGSVFKMLEDQAMEHLSQECLLEEEESSLKSRPRMYSYYQLGLKPNLDVKSRDNREICFLARGLDLLKEGKLPQLADHMAARLIAVNTASSQGWGVAKSLEIHQGEEDGPAPAHILLRAHRHTRQVEKAGGKGSWGRSQAWQQDWQGDGSWKGSGKGGKGKGKKGKSKTKGGKPWSGNEKEKGTDPNPKSGEK